MVRGDRNKINLTTDNFAKFIENGWLYVDKTKFIEHVFGDPNNVLLFTRPRRMGKSLNLNTLHTFADIRNDSASLFEGLAVSGSHVFGEINRHCVIYFDFKNYSTIRHILVEHGQYGSVDRLDHAEPGRATVKNAGGGRVCARNPSEPQAGFGAIDAKCR